MSREGESTRAERDAAQRQTDLAAAREDTDELRSSYQPRWKRLRNRLADAGIPLHDAAIATRTPEDARMESGLLVARDGRAFSFEFDFLRDEEGRDLAYEDARVTSWEELDESRKEIYRRKLEVGHEILQGEAPTG